MEFTDLKMIYPEASITERPVYESTHLSLPYKNKWIAVPQASLTENEIDLLKLVYTHRPATAAQKHHSVWYDYLAGNRAAVPSQIDSVRMIQLKLVKKDEQFDAQLWFDSAAALFDPLIDHFFFTDDLFIMLQSGEADFSTRKEIEGMLQTLEDDFSIKVFCFIGQFWSYSMNLRTLLQEELSIFSQELSHMSSRMGSLSDVSLHYFIASSLADSEVVQQLKFKLEFLEDWKELVHALWENQGNVSVAAKSLFIHRNTLQYRMEKFQEATGLSLKQMNDLALCFLLTL